MMNRGDGSNPPQRSSPHPTGAAIASPCGACRILRRRCTENCILAPHFPPTEPLKFTVAHRVFGASNIIKLLQELQENERADAVSSMVYEANARTIDPIYGSVGTIFQLQNQVNELQKQLAKAKAQIFVMKCQHVTMVCTDRSSQSKQISDDFELGSGESLEGSNPCVYLDNDQESLWDVIWA
ncbi:hypothetical protein R6Q59_012637 [Mikania micrantha]